MTAKSICDFDFHNDHDHNTDKYITLRYEVMELLKKGHLVELLKERRRQNWKIANNVVRASANPPELSPIHRIMNCITSGSEVSGVSSSSAKRHCRSLKYSASRSSETEECEAVEINFSSKNARGLHIHITTEVQPT